MKGFNKLLLIPLALLAIGGGVGVAAATGGGSDDPTGVTVAPPITTAVGSREDLSGPCDEAEHANDPRCTGAQVPDDDAVAEDDAREPGEDVSGPCDEAEHANDPRCTGGSVTGGDDAFENHDDRSGPSGNSGPGSDDSDHGDDHGGHSGHGGGNDD
jgi:hypothetical protein